MRKHSLFSGFALILGFTLSTFHNPVSTVDVEHPKPVGVTETKNILNLFNSLPGAHFVHTATASNITNNWTEINHPLTNDNPNAIVFVTQNWNPSGTFGLYNDHSIGVWYNSSTGRWAIFNQDIASMPEGADFNVLIPTVNSLIFVHTATASNINQNWTEIDHPLTNGNPDAIVLVTQNWNPGGTGGQYNDHSIGVWYNSYSGKWAIFNQDIASMPEGADFNVLIPPEDSLVFVHTAIGNITSNWTEIDHPLTNNNPDALVFVTQNWNPSGTAGRYNDHSIGVWYNSSTGRWAIFNQDKTSLPEGADFNVLISPINLSVFVHTATANNITSNWTEIDHPLTNNNPNALVFATQNWNPGGTGGQYNDHSIGVWYNSSTGRWAIFNQDKTSMPEGADFNVYIPTVGLSVFVHTATASNITSNWTDIDHPLTNNNPDAIVFVTQNWNPSGTAGRYNDHSIGVWYNNSAGRWAIFNQDLASMPDGVDFNVLIPPEDSSVFVHTATAGNITSNWTEIDHPLTNNNPNALVFVTQNWNPGGTGGQYNDHSIGVWYDGSSGRWAIFNQDFAAMENGLDFNIIVFGGKNYLPIINR